MLGAYGSIIQFLPPVLACFFWKRATTPGVIAGISTGVVINFLISFQVIPKEWTMDLHSGFWGLILNFVVMIVVSMATEKQDEAHVNKYVNCLEHEE